MKKILISILIMGVILVGCSKDKPVEVVETKPVVEEVQIEKVEVENRFFDTEVMESNNYIVNFGYFENYKDHVTNLKFNKIESTEFGDVYNILLLVDADVEEELKELGYFLVSNDLIVKLNSKDDIDSISEKVTLENAEKIGIVVCAETNMEYKLGEGMEEVNYSLNSTGDEVVFRSFSDYGAGSYEEFTWKDNVGLVKCEYGYDAEGYHLKVDLVSDEAKDSEQDITFEDGTVEKQGIEEVQQTEKENGKYKSMYFNTNTRSGNGELYFIDSYVGELTINTDVLINDDKGVLVKISYDKPFTEFVFSNEGDSTLYSDLVLGYFYEEDGKVYKLNDSLSKGDLSQEKDFMVGAKLVCIADEEIKYEDELEHTSILTVGDTIKYSMFTKGVETNYFERIEFKQNQGIVAYSRGYGAMRDAINITSIE